MLLNLRFFSKNIHTLKDSLGKEADLVREYSFVEYLLCIIKRVELDTQKNVQLKSLKPELARWILDQKIKADKSKLTDSEILSLLLIGIKIKLPKGVSLRSNANFKMDQVMGRGSTTKS